MITNRHGRRIVRNRRAQAARKAISANRRTLLAYEFAWRTVESLPSTKGPFVHCPIRWIPAREIVNPFPPVTVQAIPICADTHWYGPDPVADP